MMLVKTKTRKLLLFVAILLFATVIGFISKPDKAEAVVCTNPGYAADRPVNIFPRDRTGMIEDLGCINGNSFIWLSTYWAGSSVEVPNAGLRVFYNINDLAGQPWVFDYISFQTQINGNHRCGSNIDIGIPQTGAPNQRMYRNPFAGCNIEMPGGFFINQGMLSYNPKYGTNMRYVDINMRQVTASSNAQIRALSSFWGAKITFQEQAGGTPFSLWTAPEFIGLHEPMTYTMKFSPDCTIAPGATVPVTLQWFDMDIGAPPQNNNPQPVVMYLVDDTTGAHVTPPGGVSSAWYPMGGDNVGGSYGPVSLTGGHDYRWIWSEVTRSNGVQIIMPFSEINADPSSNCVPPNVAPTLSIDASCSATGTVSVRLIAADANGDPLTGSFSGPDGISGTALNTTVTFPNRPRDGTTKTISGSVSDGRGGTANASDTYSCSPPPPQISCTTSPVSASINTPFSILMNISHNGPALAPGITSYTATSTVNGTTATASGGAIANGASTGNFPLSPTVSIAAAGVYPIPGSITVTGPGFSGVVPCNAPATIPGVPPGTPPNNPSVTISTLPYIKVTGDDVAAGFQFTNTAASPYSCPASPASGTGSGRVIGYNAVDTGPDPDVFVGSSGEFGVRARSVIYGFYSDANQPTVKNPDGAGLSFANTGTGVNVTAPNYGGAFGNGGCITDHYLTAQRSNIPTISGTTANVASLSGSAGTLKQVLVNGDLTLTASNNYNSQVSVFVNGNVYIEGDISASPANFASANGIPFLGLFVRGNIYVDNDVSRVDGFLVAQPRYTVNAFTANTGVIYTCATAIGSQVVEDSTSPSELNTLCANQLTFNGYVIARRIKLLRTNGNISTAPLNQNPSEIFNAAPEYFLIDELPLNSIDGSYDSAATLPPIL
jgi:hypothetical protein